MKCPVFACSSRCVTCRPRFPTSLPSEPPIRHSSERMHASRPTTPSADSRSTVSGKYFVSLVVETQPAPLPKTGEAVGIDFGVARLATLSNGERISNPKHGAKWQRRLAFYQKRLARAKKGSKRREKVKRHVARI